MSFLTDALKSGVSSISGAVSEKLGIDPATAQGFVDSALPADPVETVAAIGEAAPTPEAEGVFGQAAALLGGSEGMMDKAKGLLDQDGDGNPLNDITGMVGKIFGKS